MLQNPKGLSCGSHTGAAKGSKQRPHLLLQAPFHLLACVGQVAEQFAQRPGLAAESPLALDPIPNQQLWGVGVKSYKAAIKIMDHRNKQLVLSSIALLAVFTR